MLEALRLVRAGLYQERPVAGVPVPGAPAPEVRRLPMEVSGGVATIFVSGPMLKGPSKFSETDTLQVRRAVRMATAAESVRGILLLIDSPGGVVAGTQELADDVAAAGKEKPVHAHIDDLGCSAAYWVASQAGRITANRTAVVGSIGAFTVIEDTSAVADALGVRVHVVQSGPMKAGAVDGVPVTAEVLDETQRIVDALAGDFFAAVGHGRRLRGKALDSVTSGEVWTAGEAQGVGLLDEVGSAEAAMIGLEKAIRQRGTPRRDRAAAARRMLDLR